jgi:hypothetical protein
MTVETEIPLDEPPESPRGSFRNLSGSARALSRETNNRCASNAVACSQPASYCPSEGTSAPP